MSEESIRDAPRLSQQLLLRYRASLGPEALFALFSALVHAIIRVESHSFQLDLLNVISRLAAETDGPAEVIGALQSMGQIEVTCVKTTYKGGTRGKKAKAIKKVRQQPYNSHRVFVRSFDAFPSRIRPCVSHWHPRSSCPHGPVLSTLSLSLSLADRGRVSTGHAGPH